MNYLIITIIIIIIINELFNNNNNNQKHKQPIPPSQERAVDSVLAQLKEDFPIN